MGRKKKEVIEEIKKDDNVTEEVAIEKTTSISKEEILDAVDVVSKEAKKEIRKEKSSNFFKELGAFLVIVLIIGGIVFGTYYWYKNIYEPNKNVVNNEKIDESTKMKLVTVEASDYFDILDNKYVVFTDGDYVTKVTDIKGNILFEGEVEGTYNYLDSSDNLYVVSYDEGDYSNKVTVNKLVSNKFEEVIVLAKDNVYFRPVLYNYEILIGFAGYNTNSDNYFDEAANDDYFYALGDEEVAIGEYHFVGDGSVDYMYGDIFTSSDKYIVIAKDLESNPKYGLYDISKKEIILDASYNELISVSQDAFIAMNDNKVGIINSKSEKLVNFDYDFIAPFDNHFVVSKNNKLAIMDNEYNLITGFVFDFDDNNGKLKYEYRLCCSEFNTVYSYKIGDKYVLNNHYIAERYRYDSDYIYVIDSKGDYEEIEASHFVSDFRMIYSYYEGVFKFYNEDLSLKYEIDLNDFDKYKPSLSDYGIVSLVNDNTLEFVNEYYFSYEDGKSIENVLDWSYEAGNAKIVYDAANNEYVLTIGDDEKIMDKVVSVDILEDGSFYLYSSEGFYSVQRSE